MRFINVLSCTSLILLMACSAKSSQNSSEINPTINPTEISKQVADLTPEQSKQAMNEVGKNWLYGDGLGSTILNVGATVAFPPYGALLLTNFALSASGYETIGVSSVLNEESKQTWNESYSTVVSGPGRVVAAVAGEEYRNPNLSKKKIEKYFALGNTDPISDDY
jgi:hypothetical protein